MNQIKLLIAVRRQETPEGCSHLDVVAVVTPGGQADAVHRDGAQERELDGHVLIASQGSFCCNIRHRGSVRIH